MFDSNNKEKETECPNSSSTELDDKTFNKLVTNSLGIILATMFLENKPRLWIPEEKEKLKEKIQHLKIKLDENKLRTWKIPTNPSAEINLDFDLVPKNCSDCKGSKKITLLTSVVDCTKCK